MLMRTDPPRDLDRFTQRPWGSPARRAAVPIDAWRDGEQFVIEFDLPGVGQDSLDLTLERDLVTVDATRAEVDPHWEMLAAERPRGVFSRRLVLVDDVNTDQADASYNDGVLRLRIPLGHNAKPHKIVIDSGDAREVHEPNRPVSAA